MNDLMDLDWSSPSKPNAVKPPPPSLLSVPAAPAIKPRPPTLQNGPTMLSPLPSASSRASPSPTTGPIRSSTPNTALTSASPAPPNDAFSSLFSINGSSSSGKPLSMAEKQAQLAKERQDKADHEKAQFEAHSSFWDNLGSSSRASPVLSPSEPYGDVLKPNTAPSSRPPSAIPKPSILEPAPELEHDWGDDNLLGGGPSRSVGPASSSSSIAKPSALSPDDPFDFDALQAATKHVASKPSSGMRTPVSDFDFGEKEKGQESDDDLLAGLTSTRPAPSLPKPTPRVRSTQDSRAGTRPSSPPPHIVGQFVEMGFSPEEAREALAKTKSGHDVEAAMEILLGQNASNRPSAGEDDIRRQQEEDERERERERRRRRRAGPSRDTVKPRTKDEIRGEANQPIDTDKILAQASEIGQNVLSRATLLWNSSKEKAIKAYEEQRRTMEDKGRVKDGRPRWMVDDMEGDHPPHTQGETFKDEDEDEVSPRPRPRRQRPREDPSERRAPRANGVSKAHRPLDHDLLEEAPTHRPSAARPKPVAQKPKTPEPLPARKLVEASPTQLDTASKHKARGNEHFKLGRFAEADSAYTAAVAALPDGHLFLVPIYNNRAATRLKMGDSTASLADCSAVIDLIGPSYHPAKEAPLPSDMSSEVKLGDALVKAIIKRAQAAEMGEKWSAALEDWERLVGMDAALLGGSALATRNLASEGIKRCRRMAEGPPASPVRLTKPPPAAPPARPADVSKSQAVAELRKVAASNDAEDAQRLALKDTVDAKVQAWKSGKENNLRGLIASLDMVLWDEILSGGLKVGMHELIQEKQVKIKYMKVIARLHPDKLSTTKTTVEQRMLANAAFGILSDAWQAFNKG